jgi:hypothetical protein
MTRFEIISNQSVEADLLELLDEAWPGIYYTLLPGILGRGRQGVRRGDPIWPERNALVLIYAETVEEREAVLRAVRALKKHFPREGIKLFAYEVEPIRL